ncbi:MAG TPA: hypothetical protein VF796_29710 [Humisphaera sp.]
MRRVARYIVAGTLLYATWLLFLGVHEAGHVLLAALTGGTVERVDLPLFGLSRTDVSPNPEPTLVAAGGPALGMVLPLLIWAAIPRRRRGRARPAAQFVAGFCLVGNGLYLAAGCYDRVGDPGDLLRRGVPAWLLVATGLAAAAGGLWLWHLLGLRDRKRRGA